MRDILLASLVLSLGIIALRRPWVGIMLWTWLSIMNPHRYTYGFAYDAPLAAIAVGTTVIGMFATRDRRESPFKGAATKFLVAFMMWMTLSWLLGLDPAQDYEQWKKIMKIDIMIVAALAVLHTKQHVLALLWVSAGSLALLGIKGGVFTLLTGGNYRVWGPTDSFIEDNNEFALSLVMTIPLLRFLQQQLVGKWARLGVWLVMLLCGVAAIGSYSRGALLAISAMLVALWWRGKNKIFIGIGMVLGSVLLVAFMPDAWNARMSSINDYETDLSALGRIRAWWTAWGIGLHYPTGIGFDAARPELFAMYSPYPTFVHAAHSIYFQTLGNHGFIGLFLFLGIWIASWRAAGWLRSSAKIGPQTTWCAELGAMCQVSLIGYAVGGAFLSLAYFDLPYDIMVALVVARRWVEERGWETEPQQPFAWRWVPGLAKPSAVAPAVKGRPPSHA
ncbi:MAG: putative O-glycosylation ligase, exosortase A system-associated [Burkholderiaceae bacterium]